jgi:hypothetical protein
VADLELQLRALAADAVWPPTPDLQSAVLARLAEAPAPQPAAAPDRRPVRRRRRLLAAAVAALVLIPAAGAVAFPQARDDVLEWLGLRNVEVRRVPEPPASTRPQLEEDLGRVVTLAEAERESGFRAAIPEALGPPDRVRVTGQRISLIYEASDDLPALDGVDAGLILSQSRGGIRGEYLEKMLLGGTNVEQVDVAGHPGAYISGGEHAYLYETPDGTIEQDSPLLAGPTLIWLRSGLVFRMETRAERALALEIARGTTR